MLRLIHRPRPAPVSFLVLKNGSNTCDFVDAAIPGASSAMRRRTLPRPDFGLLYLVAQTAKFPFVGTASIAFESRLMSTWRNSSGLPYTSGTISSFFRRVKCRELIAVSQTASASPNNLIDIYIGPYTSLDSPSPEPTALSRREFDTDTQLRSYRFAQPQHATSQ